MGGGGGGGGVCVTGELREVRVDSCPRGGAIRRRGFPGNTRHHG